MNEIMDYMEKNPDIMRIQDSHCREYPSVLGEQHVWQLC